MALELFEEFRMVVSALEEAGLDYAVVGAIALAIHGVPRATTDIDILVEPEALDRVLDIARNCGYRILAKRMKFRDGMEIQRATKFEEGEHLTLDLILVNENLRSVWESRMRIETDHGPIRVISRQALIEMKAAAGRPRDLGDIESLEELDR